MGIEQLISSTSFKTFSFIEWDESLLIHNYDRLSNYLKANLGQEYSNLLAKPRIRNEKRGDFKIDWLSSCFNEKPVALSNLPYNEKRKYRSLLKQHLEEVNLFMDSLESKSNNKSWSDLIARAFTFGGEEYVYCGEDKVVIAGWGAKPLESKDLVSLSKDFGVGSLNSQLSRTDSPESMEDEKDDDTIEGNTSREQHDLMSDEINPEDEDLDEKQSSFGTHEQVGDKSRQENTKDKQEKDFPPEDPQKRGGKSFFDRWWKFIVLLFFIAGALFFFKQCSGGKDFLPSGPGDIVPVKPDDISMDRDSVYYIARDRLNIYLEGQNTDALQFAKEFKEHYPESRYEIIYYDTLVARLQIRVPANEREKLKKDIPKKLESFDLLIWNESIFQQNHVPSDPGFSSAGKFWHLEKIGAFSAWNSEIGDKEIKIAVLDNGFDLDHAELSGKSVVPYNIIRKNNNVQPDNNASHGTHVATIAVGNYENGSGVCGVAPGCSLIPIKVSENEGPISQTAVVDGILYAIRQGADVINLSLGTFFNPALSTLPPSVQISMIKNGMKEQENFWDEIFALAEKNNSTLILAAGNQNLMAGLDPMQRNPLGIKVSATSPDNQKAEFSNYGQYSTVSAPGVKIYSAIPEKQYAYLDGTSMAAPVVSGAVGLIKSVYPKIKTSEIIYTLSTTGLTVYSPGKPVGNLIQLDQIFESLENRADSNNEGGTPPENNVGACDDIRAKINDLYRQIEDLEKLCPQIGAIQDTMRIPDDLANLDFMNGLWKSTTNIHNDDGEEVVLYFRFNSSDKGKLILSEPDGTKCYDDLSVDYSNGTIKIDQFSQSECVPPGKTYYPYTFTCESDSKGYATCFAQNESYRANTFNFTLIKIE